MAPKAIRRPSSRVCGGSPPCFGGGSGSIAVAVGVVRTDVPPATERKGIVHTEANMASVAHR